jgi:alpha-L-arabinofuranosidase
VNQIERLGDRIGIACSANCLQPYRQNDNGWNQGLLFLSPSQVWPQPPYFVTQMISRNFMPLNVNVESRSPRHALDVAATKSADGKTLVLQVVNMDSTPISASISLPGFAPRKSAARATILTGDWEATNTPEEPNRVKPVATVWPHGGCPEGVTTNTFPPRSFTVLRLE